MTFSLRPGLRFDATQSIFDASDEHALATLARAARRAAAGRPLLLVAENEPQDERLLRCSESGGYGLDAAWNDDFHHSAVVAAPGRREAYYSDYQGTSQELISAVKRGYLYQGQYYAWQSKPRGSSVLDLPSHRFVHYLQNHDQVANSVRGHRLHQLTSPGRLRALTALLLLSPPLPMLFQGQEIAASAPFLFFADHEPTSPAVSATAVSSTSSSSLVVRRRGRLCVEARSAPRSLVREERAYPSVCK